MERVGFGYNSDINGALIMLYSDEPLKEINNFLNTKEKEIEKTLGFYFRNINKIKELNYNEHKENTFLMFNDVQLTEDNRMMLLSLTHIRNVRSILMRIEGIGGRKSGLGKPNGLTHEQTVEAMKRLLRNDSKGGQVTNDMIEQAKRIKIQDLYAFEKPTMYSNRFRALCPFHTEKTPSFFIFDKNRFKCFSCSQSGDSINFYMKINNVNFITAVKQMVNL